MSDEDAYMALVTSNAQSELTPLERGLHALRVTVRGDPEKGVKGYAKRINRPQPTVAREVMAARVARSYSNLDCPSDAFATAASPSWVTGRAVAGRGIVPIPGVAVAGGGTGKGTEIVD